MRRARIAAAVSLAGVALVAACNAIWGIDAPIAADGGAPDALADGQNPDAPHPSDAPMPDGNIGDGPTGSDSLTSDRENDDAGPVFDGNCNCGPDCSVVVAGNLQDPSSIAADPAGVYWVSGGPTIQGVAFGGPVHSLASDNGGSVEDIALTNSAVFWVDDELGTIFGCSRATCSPVNLVTNGNGFFGITSSTSLAGATGMLYFSAGSFGIEDCAVTANPSSCTRAIAVAPDAGTAAVAVDPGKRFMAWTTNGGIFGCPLSSSQCTSVTLLAPDTPSSVHVLGADVYWLGSDGLSLLETKIGSATDAGPQTLYTMQPSSAAMDVAIDPTTGFAYWVDSQGSVWKAPTDVEGTPVVVATGPFAGEHVVVNGACVFWTLVQGGPPSIGAVMAAPE